MFIIFALLCCSLSQSMTSDDNILTKTFGFDFHNRQSLAWFSALLWAANAATLVARPPTHCKRGPNEYQEFIWAYWAGLWAVMYDRLVRRSKNTMNLTIKYPCFNKKIRKSQVVTWPFSRPVIGSNYLVMRNKNYQNSGTCGTWWADMILKPTRFTWCNLK